MLIGTSCRRSLRLVAVTMMSPASTGAGLAGTAAGGAAAGSCAAARLDRPSAVDVRSSVVTQRVALLREVPRAISPTSLYGQIALQLVLSLLLSAESPPLFHSRQVANGYSSTTVPKLCLNGPSH